MTEPLDELYFDWLVNQVARKGRTYNHLFWMLHTKEFVWFIPNDDNRVADGRDLRMRFLEEKNLQEIDSSWMDLGCSMLEMLIALSERLEFESESNAHVWFWTLLRNIKVLVDDAEWTKPKRRHAAEDRVDDVIWRTYDFDGSGGLFPLKNPSEDQREVEIWYQMNAYLMEGG